MKTPTIIITYTSFPASPLNGVVGHTELSDRWDDHVCKVGDPPRKLLDYVHSNFGSLGTFKLDEGLPIDGLSNELLRDFARNQYRLFATGCAEHGNGNTVLNLDLSTAL